MTSEFGPKIIFEFSNGIYITETVVNTWIIMAVLVIGSILLTRNMKLVPEGKQNVVEMIVDMLYGFVASTMGKDKLGFTPYMGTLMGFIMIANLWGLIGLRAPTADLNTTFALSLLTFFMIHFFGIKSKGFGGYVKSTYLEPVAVLAPLNIISEIATPVSLAFRLFGNIVGGMIIMSLMYGALASFSSFLPFPLLMLAIPTPFHFYFDLFAGVLQSFIFTMLTMVFVSNSID